MLDQLLEQFDSIDLEQPRFYSRPCTRCLRCERTDLTLKWYNEANFFSCKRCRGPLFQAVGLGAENQVTREIRWIERFEIADEIGTPPTFSLIEPEPSSYSVWYGGGFRDGPDPLYLNSVRFYIPDYEVLLEDGRYVEFTSLASAILYAVKEFKRGFFTFDMTLDGNPLTYHEIMEVFAPR